MASHFPPRSFGSIRLSFSSFLSAVLAVAPIAAPAPSLAGVERADGKVTATTCAELAGVLDRWKQAPPEWPGLLFEGPVLKTERDGPTALVFVCLSPDATAVCIDLGNPRLASGDRVRVQGVVSGTWDKGPVLDPCGAARLD